MLTIFDHTQSEAVRDLSYLHPLPSVPLLPSPPSCLAQVSQLIFPQGALQAGDLMQDLKTGHLLGAAPVAQFWGQVIGATVGAVVSAFIYRLYTA